MTHNRRPDVLPVERASIAEALDAVDVLAEIGLHASSLRAARARDTIRSALERAAAEGEALKRELANASNRAIVSEFNAGSATPADEVAGLPK
jgi:hypothetical protein